MDAMRGELADVSGSGWLCVVMALPGSSTVWWARQDLNLGPTDYESAALTAELRAP